MQLNIWLTETGLWKSQDANICEIFAWQFQFHTYRFSFSLFSFPCAGADANASHHPGLAIGSHIAAEMRDAIRSKIGLTGCAGVATNKLLAKLVSGTFKPNQQTVLLQENVGDIMECLSGLRKVPGAHPKTFQSWINSFKVFYN